MSKNIGIHASEPVVRGGTAAASGPGPPSLRRCRVLHPSRVLSPSEGQGALLHCLSLFAFSMMKERRLRANCFEECCRDDVLGCSEDSCRALECSVSELRSDVPA